MKNDIYSELFILTKSFYVEDLHAVIDYNLALGWDKITIYDNESYVDITYDHPKVDIIELKGFPAQTKLYADYSKQNPNNAEWICFQDDDEMIYLNGDIDINTFLQKYEVYDTLCLNIINMCKLPVLVDRQDDIFYNVYTNGSTSVGSLSHVSSIVKPSKVKSFPTPHIPILHSGTCKLYDGTNTVGPSNNKILLDNVFFHYPFRSHNEYVQKISRRCADDGRDRSLYGETQIKDYIVSINSAFDLNSIDNRMKEFATNMIKNKGTK